MSNMMLDSLLLAFYVLQGGALGSHVCVRSVTI